MSGLPKQFYEDRALRDSARSVFLADLEHAKKSLSTKGFAQRLTDRITGRIGDGTKDVFEIAAAGAEANRSLIGILLAALVLWLARTPILEALGVQDLEVDDAPEDDEGIASDEETETFEDEPDGPDWFCEAAEELEIAEVMPGESDV